MFPPRMAEWVTAEGTRLHHPNREKGSSKATKALVILLIIVSVALMVILTIGGWSKLQGAKPLQIGIILLYLLLAFYIARWSRGALTLIAAFGILVLIFCAIAGPQWLARDKSGFTAPALDESILGLICLILMPVQALLIAFAMRGFAQQWNVEEEVPGGREEPYGGPPQGAPAPA